MNITSALVHRLVAAQFPQWAHLAVRPAQNDGHDNRTFHLGDAMSVRLPSEEGYAPQIEKEQRWLPRLAPHLPLPVPVPLAMGAPSAECPWPWSVRRWLEGEPATRENTPNLRQFALDLARFLRALYQIDANDGPPAGAHNFYRGGSLSVYDAQTREAISALGAQIDGAKAARVWEDALNAKWHGQPVWVHGDIAPGNLLVQDGRLCAVIDFGTGAVGDPACDLAIAWTFLDAASRAAFRAAIGLGDGAWARAKGWALWKALIVCAGLTDPNEYDAQNSPRILREVMSLS